MPLPGFFPVFIVIVAAAVRKRHNLFTAAWISMKAAKTIGNIAAIEDSRSWRSGTRGC
jgi:hypothetical protein